MIFLYSIIWLDTDKICFCTLFHHKYKNTLLQFSGLVGKYWVLNGRSQRVWKHELWTPNRIHVCNNLKTTYGPTSSNATWSDEATTWQQGREQYHPTAAACPAEHMVHWTSIHSMPCVTSLLCNPASYVHTLARTTNWIADFTVLH